MMIKSILIMNVQMGLLEGRNCARISYFTTSACLDNFTLRVGDNVLMTVATATTTTTITAHISIITAHVSAIAILTFIIGHCHGGIIPN
jgi:hypothetical protein